MASRLSAGTYAAPGTWASAQGDINLSNESSNPGAAWMNSGGFGVSNTATSQLFPILPPNATPSVSGITESGTTVTVTLGSPHGLAIGSSGQTVVISTGVGGYNGSFSITSVTGPYSFTYTAGSSGLTSPTGLGTASLLGGSVAALRAFQPVLNGTTINGQVTGAVEVWGDNAIWDTTNSRYITPQLAGFDPASMQTSRS
jgi:hypothetical protein